MEKENKRTNMELRAQPKYFYGKVGSLTKLTERQVKVLSKLDELVKELGDELEVVDNTYGVLKTKKLGAFKINNPVVIGNLLGSSYKANYTVIENIAKRHKTFLYTAQVTIEEFLRENKEKFMENFFNINIPIDLKQRYIDYLEKTIENNAQKTTLEIVKEIDSIEYKVGNNTKKVKYYFYKLNNEILNDILCFDQTTIAKILQEHESSRLKLKVNADAFMSEKILSIVSLSNRISYYLFEEEKQIKEAMCDVEKLLVEKLNESYLLPKGVKFDLIVGANSRNCVNCLKYDKDRGCRILNSSIQQCVLYELNEYNFNCALFQQKKEES